jgi:hypothetical protein
MYRMDKVKRFMKGTNSFIERQGDRILSSRFVLYFIIFITFFNILGHTIVRDLRTPLIFILVSYVTSFFSKNMIVILSMGLVVANVFKYGTTFTVNEGMESKEPSEATSVDEPEKRIDTPKSKLSLADIANRKKDLEFIKGKYNDLLKLQTTIIDNVGSLEKTLTKMNTIVEDVRDNVESIKTEAEGMKAEKDRD